MIKWGSKMIINAKEIQLSIEFISVADKLKAIQEHYPVFYKAWRSMLANRSVDEITDTWRGINGLAQFITDTSTLPNAGMPGVKLKRKNPMYVFSALNVHWVIPKNKEKLTILQVRNKDLAGNESSNSDAVYQNLFNTVPQVQEETSIKLTDVDAMYKKISILYPTYDDRMERFNELGCTFNQSLEEKLELDILNKLLFNIELPTEVKPSKYEDI